ncbi:MAG: hypothetical protein EOO24_67105, partial [Comamonadaceae bacterium]
MPSTQPLPASSIEVPQVDTDEPVAVIPVASVAPLDGPPDAERITAFALVPRHAGRTTADFNAAALRDSVLRKPLTAVAAAFSLGLVVARLLR